MPRAYKDNQLVEVFYSSRNAQVRGLGRVETYTSSERKYSVRMLSYRDYYIPTYYYRRQLAPLPHDKVLKVWSREMSPSFDIKPHIHNMERTRVSALQDMYREVKRRFDKPSEFKDFDGSAVNNYFSSNADDWQDYRDGGGGTILQHLAYVSFCLQRLQNSPKTKNYVSTKYFERSDYDVWRY